MSGTQRESVVREAFKDLLKGWRDRTTSYSSRNTSSSRLEEAATVFLDPLSVTGDDPDHARGEQRFIIFGMSVRGRLLVVAHSDDGDRLRIISARPATKRERNIYEEG